MPVQETRQEALLTRLAELAQRTSEQRRRSAEAISAAQALLERVEKDRLRSGRARLEALAAARASAEEAAHQARELLGAVAHDLKQPLHVLTMAVELLAEKAGQPGARNAARARTAIGTIEAALNGLLEAARAEATAMPHARPVALMPMLRELHERLGPIAERKGLRFHVRRSGLVVRSDPRLLASILQNLCDNAIKYTSSGGVLVGIRRQGERARIDVVDTGPGIPAEDLERIFSAYVQLDGASDGVGLGLALVRRHAEQLGHVVSVRSEPGRGTRFSVELPVDVSAAARAFALADDLHRRADAAHSAAEEAHPRVDHLHRAIDDSVQHGSTEQP